MCRNTGKCREQRAHNEWCTILLVVDRTALEISPVLEGLGEPCDDLLIGGIALQKLWALTDHLRCFPPSERREGRVRVGDQIILHVGQEDGVEAVISQHS